MRPHRFHDKETSKTKFPLNSVISLELILVEIIFKPFLNKNNFNKKNS